MQNFVDGVVSDADDKTVGYTYNGAGLTSLTAYLTGRGRSDRGVCVRGHGRGRERDRIERRGGGDPVAGRLDGRGSVTEQEVQTFNALGQVLTSTDRQRTTQHVELRCARPGHE